MKLMPPKAVALTTEHIKSRLQKYRLHAQRSKVSSECSNYSLSCTPSYLTSCPQKYRRLSLLGLNLSSYVQEFALFDLSRKLLDSPRAHLILPAAHGSPNSFACLIRPSSLARVYFASFRFPTKRRQSTYVRPVISSSGGGC